MPRSRSDESRPGSDYGPGDASRPGALIPYNNPNSIVRWARGELREILRLRVRMAQPRITLTRTETGTGGGTRGSLGAVLRATIMGAMLDREPMDGPRG